MMKLLKFLFGRLKNGEPTREVIEDVAELIAPKPAIEIAEGAAAVLKLVKKKKKAKK
jgi:hypothetical protein